jgi:hypothetical protein
VIPAEGFNPQRVAAVSAGIEATFGSTVLKRAPSLIEIIGVTMRVDRYRRNWAATVDSFIYTAEKRLRLSCLSRQY